MREIMHLFCDMYCHLFLALLCPHLSCKAHKSQAGYERNRRQSSKTKSKFACKQLYFNKGRWSGNHTAIVDNEGKNKAGWWRVKHTKIVDKKVVTR